jgi:hypothetical protein
VRVLRRFRRGISVSGDAKTRSRPIDVTHEVRIPPPRAATSLRPARTLRYAGNVGTTAACGGGAEERRLGTSPPLRAFPIQTT